jgi:hypothetical protein
MVAPRSISACAKSPLRAAGTSACVAARIAGFAAGEFALDREQTRHHALDIAVDRRRRRIERNRRDGGCRIGPDAGKLREISLAGGKPFVRQRRDGLRARMQVAGARVIAEAGPQPQHIVERRCCQRANIGPAFDEPREVRRHRTHGGLLKHDLGEPYAVRVRNLAGCRAPRQNAAVAVVPGE